MRIEVDFPSIFNTALPKAYIKKVSLFPSTVTGDNRGISYDTLAEDELVIDKYGKRKPRSRNNINEVSNSSGQALKIVTEVTIKERIKEDGNTTWYNNKKFNEFLNLRIVLARTRGAIEQLEEGRFTPKFLRRLKKRGRVEEKIISLKQNQTSILEQKIETIDGKQVYCTTYRVTFKLANYNPRNLSVFAATYVDLRQYYLKTSPEVSSSRRFLQGTTVSQRIIDGGDTVTDSNIYLLPNNKLWAGPIHYHEPSGYMVGAFHSSRPHEILERKKVPNMVVKDYRILERVRKSKFLLRPEKRSRVRNLKTKSSSGTKFINKNLYITEPDYAFDKDNNLRFVFHLDMHKLIAEKSQFGAIFRQADVSAKEEIVSNTKIKNLLILRRRVKEGFKQGDAITFQEGPDVDEIVAQTGERKQNIVRPRRTIAPKVPEFAESEDVLTGGIREIRLEADGSEGIRTFTVSDFGMSRKTDGMFSHSVDMEIQDGTLLFINKQKNKLIDAIAALTEYYNVAKNPENTNIKTGLFTDDFIKELEQQYKIPEFSDVNIPNRRRRRRAVQSSIAKAPWLNAIAVYADIMRNLTNVSRNNITRAAFLLQSIVGPSSGTVGGIEILLNLLQDVQNKLNVSVIGGRNRSGSPLSSTGLRPIDEIDFTSRTTSFKGKEPKTSIRMVKNFKTIHDSNIQKSVGYDFLNLQKSNNLGLRVINSDRMGQRLSLENQKYFSRDAVSDFDSPNVKDSETSENFTQFIDLEDAYYSYLTPAKVLYGNKILKLINRGRRLWNTTQYSSIISNIENTTKQKFNLATNNRPESKSFRTSFYKKSDPPITYASDYNKQKSKVDRDVYETNAVNSVIMSKYGITLSTKKTERAFRLSEDILEGLDDFELDSRKSSKYLSSNSEFVSGSIEVQQLATQPIDDTQLRDFSSVSNIFVKSSILSNNGSLADVEPRAILQYRPSDETNIIDGLLEQYDDMNNSNAKKRRFISKIPNQIKSIFLGDDNRTNKNWFTFLEDKGLDVANSSRYTGLYYFNYNHINQIEVLTGFREDVDGTPQVSAPIYKIMTKELFDTISNSTKPYVCRMRTATTPFFKKSDKLSLPEYDAVFILRSKLGREDLSADTEIVEIQDEAAEDFDFETVDESIFISRLTEYEDLNTTGKKILRRLIRRDTRLGGLMPEFTSTTFVQQPEIIARVGATFAIQTEQTEGQTTSQAAQTAIATTTRTRTARTAQTSTTPRSTTPTPASTTRTSRATPMASTMSTTGGGGGGGY